MPPNTELKLSFDRLPTEYSSVLIDLGAQKVDSLKGKILKLKNVFAQVEYVSSPYLRSYFDRINEIPISYVFDECSVMYKNLPLNEQSIRLDNMRGGNTPDYVFAAIIRTAAIAGSSKYSSTSFKGADIKEIAITLNGNPVQGYPIKVTNSYPIWPFYKFYETLARLANIDAPSQHTLSTFKENIIYSHRFEGEESQQGWLGVNLTVNDPEGLADAFTLGS